MVHIFRVTVKGRGLLSRLHLGPFEMPLPVIIWYTLCTAKIGQQVQTSYGESGLLYFEVDAPNGINLFMFRNSSVTFSANIRKKKIRCVYE